VRRVALRALWEHRRRLVSTVVAIVLGVAFMSGTFVFADTVDSAFDDLFAQRNEDVDAEVQGKVLFSSGFGGDDARQRLPQGLVRRVAAVDGVAEAAPFVGVEGFGAANRVLDPQGDAIGPSAGPPTLLESWVDDEALNPYELREGRGPEAADEIALNLAAAEEGGVAVGDTVAVSSQFGVSDYTLVGIFTFGEAKSAAGAVSAELTLAEAQRLAGAPDELDAILVAAEDGVSQQEVVSRIAAVLPDDADVITGQEAAEQEADEVQEGFAFFRQILTIFGGLALLVGTFLISNTFSILVAQRTRELALLRTVGASRTQVLLSVLVEALAVGLVAAVVGLAAGVALALGVTALLEGIGVDLPTAGLVVGVRTIVIAFVVGLVVTALAATIPAVRATRVAPLAALRDVAIDRSGASRLRIALGVLVLVLALVLMSRAWTSDGDTDAVPTVGLGAVLAVVGAIVIGPALATPSVRLIGSVLPRLKGVTGRLATENAARSPKRTSATASALLIGVTLVGFTTVFAASAKESVASEVDRGIVSDLVVQADVGFGPPTGFSPEVARRIAGVDGVEAVGSFLFGEAQFRYPTGDTSRNFIGAADPRTILQFLTPRMEEGRITDLTDDGVVVDRQIAEDNDLGIGDRVTITVAGGTSLDVRVEGISDDVTVLGFWTITEAAYREVFPEDLVGQVYVNVDAGADVEAVRRDLERVVDEFPSLVVLDRDELVGDIADQLTAFVNVIYGLLALSIIIALIGIANTLSLSIHERTRELGLLRAVGMARDQVRSVVRWEAVLISVLGTLVGLGVGLALSRVIVQALEGFGLTRFAIPVGTMLVVVLVAALLGVLASVRPARRAARLDVLQAIATE
jgi:putative ABC transport system permease protein